MRRALLPVFALAILAACTGDDNPANPVPPVDASVGDNAVPTPVDPLAALPIAEELKGEGLSAPVDVVRDDAGIPHIYADNIPDAAYAQGFMMAQDRWLEMDFGRRQASGSLAEIVGDFNELALVSDMRYRTHHLRATAEAAWKQISESTDPEDKRLKAILTSFSAGVNAWQNALRQGKYALPKGGLETYYLVPSVKAWTEVDSLVLGELQAFQLSFNATSDIERSTWDKAEADKLVGNADPQKAARVGFAEDYWRSLPFDPTTTVDGWNEVPGATALAKPTKSKAARPKMSTMKGALAALEGVGIDKKNDPDRGSNNWVVSGKASTTGRAMVANDTHLSLSNPAIFYLSHLSTKDGLDVMGAQFPGIPLVTLGMNRNVGWGSTVSYIDVTDVYREAVVPCTAGGGQCVTFKGGQVKLTPREETFKVSSMGRPGTDVKVTFYDVPHHGPILPRIGSRVLDPLKSEELSVRYTGHQPGPLLKAILLLNRAKNVDEAQKALEANFTHGGQNWVLADDTGNIAWTQTIRVPRRPKGTKAWKILPGDGSAEWDGFFDPKVLPHAKNPAKGYLVTANADPVGVTKDNDPGNEPEVGGFPLYMGSDYDPGTRVSRITTRIKDALADGKKLDRDQMAQIQADAISDWGKAFRPAFVSAIDALAAEAATPGTHPDLAPMLTSASPAVKAYLADAKRLVEAWSLDTAAGTEEGATPKQIEDSKATALMAVFATKLAQNTFGDEAAELGVTLSRAPTLKLLATILTSPATLKTKEAAFDNLKTVPVETKQMTLAQSAIDAIAVMMGQGDPSTWRWGKMHTLSPQFFLPLESLSLKKVGRHGGDGTVDVASHGIEDDDYSYGSGATIRFVAMMDPEKGPVARNVIPGGQVFDPASPHYSDLYDLYVKNQTVDLAFRVDDVVARAKVEAEKNKIGRRRFVP